MSNVELLVGVWPFVICVVILALASPFLVLIMRNRCQAELVRTAKHYAVILVVPAGIAFLAAVGVSSSSHTLDLGFLIAAFVLTLVACTFSFRLRPVVLGIFVGLVATVGFLTTTFVLVSGHFLTSLEGLYRIQIGDNIYCETTATGIRDYDYTVEIFKRNPVFIRRVGSMPIGYMESPSEALLISKSKDACEALKSKISAFF